MYRKRKNISSQKKVSAHLITSGLTWNDFAEKHGFKVETVKSVVKMHWDKPTKPWGKISNSILKTLRHYCQ